MKRTIIAAWCILFSLGMYAQKALIIHKKDGTKMEIPAQAFEKFHFKGKAIVNDDDYTRVARHVVYTPVTSSKTLDISFYVLSQGDMDFTDHGICYSTTPGDVGNRLSFRESRNNHDWNVTGEGKVYGTDTLYVEISGLEFETTYYCRSYVVYRGNYYYSREHSIYTGKPKMSWYGAKVDPMQYAETGFAMPSEEAWNTLVATSFHINHLPAFLLDEWDRYATPDRIEAMKAQSNTMLECCDGTLYLLDAVDEGFVAHVMELCSKEIVMLGGEAEYNHVQEPIEVACDASWGVPGNVYWEYSGTTVTANPDLTYTTSLPLLANYKYKVEVVMAPETVDEEKLPNKYNLLFQNEYKEPLGKRMAENATQCAVHSFEVVTTQFVESVVRISGVVGSRETGYDRSLRVAQIRFTPIEPCFEEPIAE